MLDDFFGVLALGAAQGRALGMVLGEVAILIAGGLALGSIAALGATRFLASFLYGIDPNSPTLLATAAGLLAAVAVAAGFLPARTASRLDPMNALREE